MEIHILDMIQNLRTPIGDVVVPLITRLGDAGIIWIILTVLLLIIPKTRKTGVIMMAAFFGGCAALQCAHKESGGKNQTIRCQYSSTIIGRKAAGLLFPVGTHGGFICFGYGIVSCRREEDVESGSCTCGSDRIIKIVPVCALSNGHHWWCGIRKPFRISGL